MVGGSFSVAWQSWLIFVSGRPIALRLRLSADLPLSERCVLLCLGRERQFKIFIFVSIYGIET